MTWNPTLGHKPGFGPGSQVDQEVFNPLLNVADKVDYPGGVTIDAASIDAGHTNKTQILRAGLPLVRIETGAKKGKFVPVDHADAPTAEDIQEAVILLETIDMRGKDSAVEDKHHVSAMLAGTVDDAKIWYSDAAYKDAIQAALPRISFLKDVAP
jgi:hypothetical protein